MSKQTYRYGCKIYDNRFLFSFRGGGVLRNVTKLGKIFSVLWQISHLNAMSKMSPNIYYIFFGGGNPQGLHKLPREFSWKIRVLQLIIIVSISEVDHLGYLIFTSCYYYYVTGNTKIKSNIHFLIFSKFSSVFWCFGALKEQFLRICLCVYLWMYWIFM